MGVAWRKGKIASKLRAVDVEKAKCFISWGASGRSNILRTSICTHASHKSEISFKRLDDVVINRLLLSVQDACLSTILALTYSDGTIEFRDRTGVGILARDDISKQVSSMYQVGFDFADVGACKFEP